MVIKYRVSTITFSPAVFAHEAGPNGIELVHRSFDQGGIVRQDACLEVAGSGALHAETGAGQVG